MFARDDIERIRELQKKERLKKGELQELLHLISAVEPKLLNLEEPLMYALSKFQVRVAGFVGLAMHYCDVHDLLEAREKSGKLVTTRTKELFEQSRLRIDRSMKLILQVFTYSGRVTLSKNALAFKEFIRAQWELEYAREKQNTLIPTRDYLGVRDKAS